MLAKYFALVTFVDMKNMNIENYDQHSLDESANLCYTKNRTTNTKQEIGFACGEECL